MLRVLILLNLRGVVIKIFIICTGDNENDDGDDDDSIPGVYKH